MVFGRVSCRLGFILGSVFLSRCLSTESTLYKPTEDILCHGCPAVQLPVVMAAAAFTAALQNALAASGGVPLHAAGDAAVIAASKGMKALTEERRRTRRIGG